VHVH